MRKIVKHVACINLTSMTLPGNFLLYYVRPFFTAMIPFTFIAGAHYSNILNSHSKQVNKKTFSMRKLVGYRI